MRKNGNSTIQRFFNRSLVPALALAGTLFLMQDAEASTLRAHVDGPVVIAGQLFSGGEVEVVSVGSGDLIAIRVDGRQVALVYRNQVWKRPDGSDARLAFRVDLQGRRHLVGLSWYDESRTDVAPTARAFQVATVARGVATIDVTDFPSSEAYASR